jgi:hypothetical protein
MVKENRFLFKRDTIGIDVFLQRPNQSNFQRIGLNSSFIKFTPADNQNLYKIEYRPNTLPDGVYTLRVQGADASNNRTGVYQITFRVINEQRIVAVAANPNPFNDLLRVVFTVSGKDAPSEANVLITDLAGRTLKNVSLLPRVGVNEWVWTNTTDLAAGTYLYRVSVKNEGKDLPVEEGVKTTGKIVLIR